MKTTLRLLAAMLLIAILGVSATAQAPDTTKTYTLEGITVEGIRADSKAPVPQKLITITELDKVNFGQEINLLLVKLPSFTAYSDAGSYSNYSYIRLRGMDQTRINMTLDGTPLNEPEDQGVYFANMTNFAKNISDVQIQRGIGVSTNGVASYAGSMNFNSVSLTDKGGDAEISFADYNTRNYTIGYSSGMLGKFALYTRYSNSKSDGYKYHSGNTSNSWFFGGGYFGETDALKVFGYIGDAQNQLAYLAVSMDDIYKDPRTNYVSDREKDDFQESFVQVQYLKQNTGAFSYNASVYYRHLIGNFTTDYTASLLNYKLRSDFYGVLLNYNMNLENTSVHFGVHLNNYRRDHYMNLIGNSYDEYFNSGYKSEASMFAKVNHTIGLFSLFGDVQFRSTTFRYVPDLKQHSADRNVSWTFLNPRAGLTFTMNERTDFYVSIGSTGREPTRLDMFGGSDTISVAEILKLSRIQPEYVTDIELGVNYKRDNLSYKLNAYFMKFHNEIAAIGPLGELGLPLRKNVESSFRSGLEFDGTYKSGKFAVSNNSSLNFSKIDKYVTDYDGAVYDNVTPLMTPRFISNSAIEYDGRLIGLTLEGRYVSSAYLDNENSVMMPEYFTLDFTLDLHITSKMDINLRYNNLTDKRYYGGGYVYAGTPYYFVTEPKNYVLTFNVGF